MSNAKKALSRRIRTVTVAADYDCRVTDESFLPTETVRKTNHTSSTNSPPSLSPLHAVKVSTDIRRLREDDRRSVELHFCLYGRGVVVTTISLTSRTDLSSRDETTALPVERQEDIPSLHEYANAASVQLPSVETRDGIFSCLPCCEAETHSSCPLACRIEHQVGALKRAH